MSDLNESKGPEVTTTVIENPTKNQIDGNETPKTSPGSVEETPPVPKKDSDETSEKETKEIDYSKKLWLNKTPDIKVRIYLYISKETDTLEAVLINRIKTDEQEEMNVYEIVLNAVFSCPRRKQLQRYRDKSGRWVAEAQTLLTDKYLMRAQIMRYHLLSLDLIDPDTGKPFELTRDKDGKLTAQSEEKLDNLHPTVLEMVLTKFERAADLIY